MDNKYIEIIGEYLKDEDDQKLIQLCNNLNIENAKTLQIEDIYYTLAEKIESDEEILEYFKNIAKENKVYIKLFPYFKKTENIRFFIDNQREYSLSISDINKMENNFKERFDNKKKNIEKNRRKYRRIYDILGLIMSIIIIPYTISLFSPFFQTYITKQAIITDAIVLTEKRTFLISGFPTTTTYWQYEYYVDGVKYTNEDRSYSIGIDVVNKNETLEIYYQENNPSVSQVYDFSWFLFLEALVVNILMLMGAIYSFKDNKK